MSIAPNVGAISKYLTSVQRNPLYNRMSGQDRRGARRAPVAEHAHPEVGGEREVLPHARRALRGTRLPLLRPDGRARHRQPDGHPDRRAQHDGTAPASTSSRRREGIPRGNSIEKWHALPPGHDPATGKQVKSRDRKCQLHDGLRSRTE
jgi:1-deoxy-D-xylulose-5-phosphate synthase